MPAALPVNDPEGFGGTPRTWFVLIYRRHFVENRIDGGPGRFDFILAGKHRGIAIERIPDQAFVGFHLIGTLLIHEQLHFPSRHTLAGLLDMRTPRDRHIGSDTKPQVVRLTRFRLAEDSRRRRPQLHDYFGGRDRQALAGPQVERHATPAPRIDGQPQRREGLDL